VALVYGKISFAAGQTDKHRDNEGLSCYKEYLLIIGTGVLLQVRRTSTGIMRALLAIRSGY
jgi:hypothetical protein